MNLVMIQILFPGSTKAAGRDTTRIKGENFKMQVYFEKMENDLVAVHSISFWLKLPSYFTKASSLTKINKAKQYIRCLFAPLWLSDLSLPSGQLHITTGELIYKGPSTGIWQLYKLWR